MTQRCAVETEYLPMCLEETYNADGKKTMVRYCMVINDDGICEGGYFDELDITWTYDDEKQMITASLCEGKRTEEGCSRYSSIYDYKYDEYGNIISQRECSVIESNGTCSEYKHDYGVSKSANYDYDYDSNGRRISEKGCKNVDSNGDCTGYTTQADDVDTRSYGYTYDNNGNISAKYACSSYNEEGKCIFDTYNHHPSYKYTYDDRGNMITETECGYYSCPSGPTAIYTYDETEKRISSQKCDGNGNCQAVQYEYVISGTAADMLNPMYGY